MPRQWILRPPRPPRDAPDACPAKPDSAALARWSEQLGVSPFLLDLLWRRGHCDVKAMDRYLSPGLRHLIVPDAWPELGEAARALARGLAPLVGAPEAGGAFAVWADYDADGVTAAALVLDFCAKRGIAARHYIPDRVREGYGVNAAGIEALADLGVTLLLTVDCGVSDIAALTRARELGMAVVVSDHHLPGPVLPPTVALCNPRLREGPLSDLCGVGVAFFLMAAVNRLLPGPALDMRRFLDLVALGTVADVVDLNGQNRILTKNGLLLLAEAGRPGIAALKEAASFNPSAMLTAGQVAFGLAPRINAAGRMGQAEVALRLLLAPDRQTAAPLAASLESFNRLRRAEEERILALAQVQAVAQIEQPALIVQGADWHSGVIGIVASRLVEAHYKPALILSGGEGAVVGSGRSIPEFDLHAGVAACAEFLTRYGGHRQAAGFSLAEAKVEAFSARFLAEVEACLGKTPLAPTLRVDADLGFRDIDFILLKELELLEPLGMGNPEPVFVSPPLTVLRRQDFGKEGTHASLDMRDEAAGVTLRGKVWRKASFLPPDIVGKTLRVAYAPRIDRFNGAASIELTIKDWNFAE